MTENDRELLSVLKELGVPFSPELNTTDKLIETVTKKILETPEVTHLSKNALTILDKHGFDLVYSDGSRVRLD